MKTNIDAPEAYKANGTPWTVIGGLERFKAGSSANRKKYDYKYTLWTRRAERALLVNAAPRIGKLGGQFYTGCGFHYDKIERLAKCLKAVMYREERGMGMQIVTGVVVKGLFEDIVKAEKSVQKFD